MNDALREFGLTPDREVEFASRIREILERNATMPRRSQSAQFSAGAIGAPGVGVPVKVMVPPTVDEGAYVDVSGTIECASSGAATVELSLTYSDASDWLQPPATISLSGPLDAQKRRAFVLRLHARPKPGSSARTSSVFVAAPALSAAHAAVAHIAVKPRR